MTGPCGGKFFFNTHKFACVHFHSRLQHAYTIDNCTIPSHNHQKDLGIVISDNLIWTAHHHEILSKAYAKLSMIRRTFSPYNSVGTRKKLYISVIRAQLMYGSVIWRPMLIKDIVLLERLQRRSTKFILSDYGSDYKHRLIQLSLLPLMMIFELQDYMFFIKNFKDPSSTFCIQDFVSFNQSSTRSDCHKLVHLATNHNNERHFYFNRIVRLWNCLPIIDLTLSCATIKAKLKNYF